MTLESTPRAVVSRHLLALSNKPYALPAIKGELTKSFVTWPQTEYLDKCIAYTLGKTSDPYCGENISDEPSTLLHSSGHLHHYAQGVYLQHGSKQKSSKADIA